MYHLKLFAGYVASYALYAAGDLVSRVMHIVDLSYAEDAEVALDWPALSRWQTIRLAAVALIYPVYNILMCKSSDVQDWGGGSGPWNKIDFTKHINPSFDHDADVADTEGGGHD